jgi:hypothetical protein
MIAAIRDPFRVNEPTAGRPDSMRDDGAVTEGPLADRLPAALVLSLQDRLERIPTSRIRHPADYWALRDVERDHISRMARRHQLASVDREVLEAAWLRLVDSRLSDFHDRSRRARPHRMRSLSRQRLGRRIKPKVVFQAWFNTFGPGGRTWFGNRYADLRHYTFRLAWRP